MRCPGSDLALPDGRIPIDELLPKSGVEQIRFANKTTAYGSPEEKQSPTFIDPDPKQLGIQLLPTLFALWRVPSLLPCVLIPPAVSQFIIGGADLMLPGVLHLPSFREGQLVSVRVAGNPSPLAVGVAIMSSEAAVACGMRGRGVRIMHHFGDALWEWAGRPRPNAGFAHGDVVTSIGVHEPDLPSPEGASESAAAAAAAAAPADSSSNGGAGGSTKETGADTTAATAAAPAATTVASRNEAKDGGAVESEDASGPPAWWQAMSCDERLTATLLQTLKKHVKASNLPMLSNVLYGTHMTGAAPRGAHLEPKKSSWKGVAAFLQSMSTAASGARLLTLEEDKAKATLTLVSYDKQHPLLKEHKPWPSHLETAAAKAEAAAAAEAAEAERAGERHGPGASRVAPLIAEWLRPASSATNVLVATVLCAMIAQGKAAELPGAVVSSKKKRGGPASARALRTSLHSLATVVTAALAKAAKAAARAAVETSAASVSASTAAAEEDEGDDEEEEEEDDEEEEAEGEGPAVAADTAAAAAPPPLQPSAMTVEQLVRCLPPLSTLLFKKADTATLVTQYIALRGLTDARNKRAVVLDEHLARCIAGAAAAAAHDDDEDEDEEGDGAEEGAGDEGDGGDKDHAGTMRVITAAGAVPLLRFDPANPAVSLALPAAELDGAPSLPREDIIPAWQSRFSRWHTVIYTFDAGGGGGGGREVVVSKGSPPAIRISVKRIQGGRRSTTHIENASAYRLEDARLARDLQRLTAAAATVQPCARNPKVQEVMLQGDEAARVAEFLVHTYGMPRSVVQVEDSSSGEAAGKGKGGKGGGGSKKR